MIAKKTRNFRQGGSTVVVLPAALVKGAYSTLAANRLIILDPMGRISLQELLRILEELVEPAIIGRALLSSNGAGGGDDLE